MNTPVFTPHTYPAVRYSPYIEENTGMQHTSESGFVCYYVGWKIMFHLLAETGLNNAVDWAISEALKGINATINQRCDAALKQIA